MASSSPGEDNLDRLLKAAVTGDTAILQHMIQRENHNVETRGPQHEPYWNGTLLLISCENGKIDAVKKLLQLGANIEAVNQAGDNALHCAAVEGHSDVANLLLQRKPDLILQTNDGGMTVLHCAAQGGNPDIIDLLLKTKPDLIVQKTNDGNTPLDYAVIMDKSAVVWTMVHNHKVDITQCCKQWWQEKAKRLLAEEEARRAKSAEEDTNALNQGDDDRNMQLAYAISLKFGKALSRELQVLMVGAENGGKTCLIASFLGEAFIEGQKATEGADTEVCKIFCKNWSRINLSDMTVHLHHQFISQFKLNALKAVASSSEQTSVAFSSSEKGSPAKVPITENLPQPPTTDIQEASSYTPKSDPDSLNAVVWDFAGQVIFHNTHSIFISESGVPVITFNASMKLSDDIAIREGAAPPAECRTIIQSIHYWLQVVDSMCSVKGSDEDHSPLLPTALLAGTHIDKLDPDIKKARKIAKKIILPILERELLGKPYARHLAGMKNGIKAALEQCCFFVSNKLRDEEIERLKDCTISVARSLRVEQPIFFLKIEQSLLQLEEQIISKSTMANVIAKCSFSIPEDSPEFKGTVNYFHNKRTILHFSHIESLKDLIILSPRWLAKLFSYVLTAHSYTTGTELDNAWLQLTEYGILHENLLVHMLEKFQCDYPTTVRVTKQQVIDILLCFHLVAMINRKAWFAETGYPSIPESGDTFIVPSLVPRDEAKTIPCTEKERVVYFRFDTGFIPTSVLNQLIADCICRNVKRGNQLLWMRHGKVGLQLGAHQKYYISRCKEKQSIQLTITLVGDDVKCIQERAELIDDVARLLNNIMKLFMPAAKRPTLFIPCPLCSTVHITLKQVYDGESVFCPSSGDDSGLCNYYSDLLPNASTGASIKLEVFTKNYARLVDVLPIMSLTHHFVKDEIISFEEEETIMQTPGRSEAAGMVLRKIGGSLKASLTRSFDKLLAIMEQYGGAPCMELVNEMRQDLPQDITVQCLSLQFADVSTKASPEHVKHLHSHNTTVSTDADASTKPTTDEDKLSSNTNDSKASVSAKPLSDHGRHKQSPDTTGTVFANPVTYNH